jgi:hypothetical protein
VRIAEDRKYLLDDGAAQCVVSVADKGLGATMAWTAVKLAIQSEGRWVAAFSATSSSTRWGRNIESGETKGIERGVAQGLLGPPGVLTCARSRSASRQQPPR